MGGHSRLSVYDYVHGLLGRWNRNREFLQVSDLVAELRRNGKKGRELRLDLCDKAADEIERLRAENKRLDKARYRAEQRARFADD
jgi:hypothetical protein